VPIVDSHCHVSLGWYEPVEVPVVIEHLGSLNRPDDDRQHALRMPMEQLAARPEAERGEIFGGTALRVFSLR
jgi:predicted TIM-barrel fold metal-dependent hydrolase